MRYKIPLKRVEEKVSDEEKKNPRYAHLQFSVFFELMINLPTCVIRSRFPMVIYYLISISIHCRCRARFYYFFTFLLWSFRNYISRENRDCIILIGSWSAMVSVIGTKGGISEIKHHFQTLPAVLQPTDCLLFVS